MQLSDETLPNLASMDIELPRRNGIRDLGSPKTAFRTFRMERFVIFCKNQHFHFQIGRYTGSPQVTPHVLVLKCAHIYQVIKSGRIFPCFSSDRISGLSKSDHKSFVSIYKSGKSMKTKDTVRLLPFQRFQDYPLPR